MSKYERNCLLFLIVQYNDSAGTLECLTHFEFQYGFQRKELCHCREKVRLEMRSLAFDAVASMCIVRLSVTGKINDKV